MAKVQVQVAGGDIQSKEAYTVGDLKRMLDAEGYDAMVNGETESDSYELEDFNFVVLTKKVKGA